MEKKTTAQAIRSKEKKEHIFRTAMQMYKHHGYGATTVRDICREAGISNSTFYHFFGDKAGVLMEFYRRLFRDRADYLAHTPENLRRPFRAIYRYLLHASELQDLMGKEFARETLMSKAHIFEEPNERSGRYSSLLQIAGFIQAAVDAGTLPRDIHPWHTAEYLITGASGVVFNWLAFSDTDSACVMMRRLLPLIFRSVTDEELDAED